MAFNKCRIGFMTVLILMIISIAGKAWAYPVPTADIKRILASIQVTMQQVMQIKQEIDSNLNIIKEIQNGGYAQAAGDLFAKIQNGDYDRFGENLKGLQDSTYKLTHSAKKVKERMEKLEKKRQELEKKVLEKEKALREKGNAIAEKAHKSFLGKAYNWVKDNRLVTDAALGAVNSAQSGDWSKMVSDAARGAGGVVGGGNGNEISALGGIVSSGMDIVGDSNNLGEVITNTATSSSLSKNLDILEKEHEEEEARRKEAQQKYEEEQKAKFKEQLEQQKKELKQKECQECRAKNPTSACISACSF